jgi:DNA-binding GntR family transcriptional regulator
MRAQKASRGKNGRASTTLAQRVYEGLCDDITSGKLKPGTVLSRRKIAASYGTSYMPVTEAMRRLENTGLIEVESAQMARVRKVTLESIEHTYTLREALETQAIRLACQTATDAEIDELCRLAESVDALYGSVKSAGSAVNNKECLLLDWQFHCRIAEISRCPLLVEELTRIQLLRHPLAVRIHVPSGADRARLHGWLADAIKARDPLAADARMREHVQLGLKKQRHWYQVQAARMSD